MAEEKKAPSAQDVPNATTQKAMKELEEGRGKRFIDPEELFEDIGA